MICVGCDICDGELTNPGALVFSPPGGDNQAKNNVLHVRKYHICISCWNNKVKNLFEK
jgi:hypothetical protein